MKLPKNFSIKNFLIILFALATPLYIFITFAGKDTGTSRDDRKSLQSDKADFAKTGKNSNGSYKVEQLKADGISFLYYHTPLLPIVDIDIIFDAGAMRDPKGKLGLASLTAENLSSGADNYNADEIAEVFEENAAIYSVDVSREMTKISLRSLTNEDNLKKSLRLFTKILTSPNFPKDDFERIKDITFQALKAKEQDLNRLASDEYFKLIYKDTPVANPSIGTKETIDKIKVKDLHKFYKEYYVKENATISIVGDVSKKEAQKIVEKILDDLPKGEKAKHIAVQTLAKGEKKHIDYPSKQTHILLGGGFIDYHDSDYFPLILGNHILGGSALVSRLFDEVREKQGLAYDVRSYFIPMREKGPYTISAQTKNESKKQTLATIKKVVTDFITDGPTDDEVIRAKNNIIGGFPLRLDSNKSIIAYLDVMGFYDLPLDFLDTYTTNIAKVTSQDIKLAYQKRLQLKDLNLVTVGGK